MRLQLALLSLLLVIPVRAQVATHDLFNRSNGTNLGLDWTEIDNDLLIATNALQGNTPFSLAWGHHTNFSAGYAGTVLRCDWSMNGTSANAVSLIAGVNPTTWQGIEVRIADNNGDGLADRIFFNAAVNAGNWYGGSFFQNMTTPLSSGTATIWFSNSGNTVNVAIQNPANGSTQSYTASGISMNPPLGIRVGAGLRGAARMDNFQAWVGTPTGPVFTTPTLRTTTPFELLVKATPASSSVLIGLSLTGSGPLASPLGPIYLSDPIILLGPFAADGLGTLLLPFSALGPGSSGLTIYAQAVELTTPALTNWFTVVVI